MARTRWSLGTSSKKAQFQAPPLSLRPRRTAATSREPPPPTIESSSTAATFEPRRRRPAPEPPEEFSSRTRRTRSQTAAAKAISPELTEDEEETHPDEEEPDVVPKDEELVSSAAKKRKKGKAAVAPPTVTSPPTFLTRYRKNVLRPLIEFRLFDWPSLLVLGVNDLIRKYFARIGWERFLDIDKPAYLELSMEFYSSFKFEPRLPFHDSRAILFRMKDEPRKLSVNLVNILLGFETVESVKSDAYLSAACDMPCNFSRTIDDRWKTLSCESVYRKGCSKSAHIVDDALRLCHRFLAHNLFGRTDMMNVVTMQEIFILENMLNGIKINFGYWLATQWRYCANHFNHKMPLGALITQLARSMHINPVESIALPPARFSISDFQSMGLVFVNNQGQYQLLSPSVAGSNTPCFAGLGSSSNSTTQSELKAWLQEQSLELKNHFDQHPPRWALDLHAKIDALDRRLAQMEQHLVNPDPPPSPEH